MKKIITFILIFIFCTSFFAVSASAQAPQAVLYVSGRDADGFVTITFKVAGVIFQGVQASVYYNPEELLLTDDMLQNITVGEMQDNKQTLTAVQTALHTESSCIAFTAIMNLSLLDDEIYYLSSEKEEMEIFSLKVPATTDKPEIGFALKESPVYDKGNPNGLVISYDGASQTAETMVCYADGTKGQTGKVSEPEKQKNPEQLRAERILNTVIMQQDNYAVVKNGALCYADENNKAVMPFWNENEMYVPYRFLAEAFGHQVGWDDASQTPLLNGTLLEQPFVVINARTFISCTTAETLLNVKATMMGDTVVFAEAANPWDAYGAIEQGILSDALLIMSPAIRDMK